MKPINFTTRQPRSNTELDEYVFLTKDQFHCKEDNGDFAETTRYNGNYYGVTKFIDKTKNNVVVQTPAGREIFLQFAAENGIKFRSVFLTLDEKTMDYRLGIKRRSSFTEIQERKRDLEVMQPTKFCAIIDGRDEVEKVAEEVMKAIA